MTKLILSFFLSILSKIHLIRKEESMEVSNGLWQRQTKRHIELIEFMQQCGIKEDSKNLKILDVGCGKGLLINRLKRNGFNRVYGCDWIDSEESSFEYKKINLNEMDSLKAYVDESFDVIIASDVIEHLENPAAILREFQRIVKTDGHIFITIPNCANIKERLLFLMTGNSNRYRPQKNEYGHINYLPSKVFNELVARANLQIVKWGGGYNFLSGYFLNIKHPLLSYNLTYYLQPIK